MGVRECRCDTASFGLLLLVSCLCCFFVSFSCFLLFLSGVHRCFWMSCAVQSLSVFVSTDHVRRMAHLSSRFFSMRSPAPQSIDRQRGLETQHMQRIRRLCIEIVHERRWRGRASCSSTLDQRNARVEKVSSCFSLRPPNNASLNRRCTFDAVDLFGSQESIESGR
jgi:hypothetical protein